jgi:hypothetical protein
MKKLLVVAAIAVAGCAARTPEQKPAAPAQRAGTPRTVEVATFTAEVDPVARTFQIRSQPTAAGRALGMSGLVEIGPTTVSLANTVNEEGITQVYFNVEQREPDRLCTNDYDGPVWGANVTLTTLAANTTLSNLYVQFTAFSGPRGSEACNSVEAPADITDLGLGLWSSPVMVAGEVTQDWIFQYVTAGRFTFAGKILASVAELFPNDAYPAGNYGIVDNGTEVVYSDFDDTRLVFLEPGTGSTWNYFLSTPIPDYAWALSKDANKPRIWYATGGSFFSDAAYVGYVNSTGHGAAGGSVNVQGATAAPISVKPWAIAADPDGNLSESRAWFVASDFDNSPNVSAYVGARLGWVDREGGGAVSAPVWISNLDGTLARSLVFADADNIYVTLAPTTGPTGRRNGAIQRCTKSAGCGVTPDIIALPAECASPDVIVVSPTTGNLWFTAGADTPGGGVCTFDPLIALPARVADAPYPGYLAVGQAVVGPAGLVNEIWVAEFANDRVQRIVEGDLPFYVSTYVGPGYGSVWALGKLWVVTQDGVNRITP